MTDTRTNPILGCLLAGIFLTGCPLAGFAFNGKPAPVAAFTVRTMLVADTVPTAPKKVEDASPVKPGDLIKEVPKARKQVKPMAVSTVVIKPVIIKPKVIVKPIIKLN